MKNLINELHQRFCQDLNEAWFKAINNPGFNGLAFNPADFFDLAKLVAESQRQGYRYIFHDNIDDFIKRQFLPSFDWGELLKTPEGYLIGEFQRIIDNQDPVEEPELVASLEVVKKRDMDKLVEQFVYDHIQANGWDYSHKILFFYPGTTNFSSNLEKPNHLERQLFRFPLLFYQNR